MRAGQAGSGSGHPTAAAAVIPVSVTAAPNMTRNHRKKFRRHEITLFWAAATAGRPDAALAMTTHVIATTRIPIPTPAAASARPPAPLLLTPTEAGTKDRGCGAWDDWSVAYRRAAARAVGAVAAGGVLPAVFHRLGAH